MAGGKSCFDGKWLRGTATGEIFTTAPSHQAKVKAYRTKATEILNRVAVLAELATEI